MNVHDAAVASPPYSSDHPDAVRGPWTAILTDQYGWPCDLDEFEDDGENEPKIAVVRGTAAPKARGERRPGTYQGGDVLYEVNDFDGADDLADRWAQARLVAALLNHNQAKVDALAERASGKN